MDLKKFVVAAALGATVLTAVPALVAPHQASAGECWGEYYSDCTPDDPYDPGSGGGDDGSGGGGDGSIDVSDGSVGEPVADLPVVVITGTRVVDVFTPSDPGIPSQSWESGGGGGGGAPAGAVVWSKGQTWNERQNCYRNSSAVAQKMSENAQYQVSYKVSANISAKAAEVLTASLGTEVNTQITKSYGVEITLNPGETWALNVEYQTVVYAITTTDLFGRNTTEYVNVTQPTGVLTGTSC